MQTTMAAPVTGQRKPASQHVGVKRPRDAEEDLHQDHTPVATGILPHNAYPRLSYKKHFLVTWREQQQRKLKTEHPTHNCQETEGNRSLEERITMEARDPMDSEPSSQKAPSNSFPHGTCLVLQAPKQTTVAAPEVAICCDVPEAPLQVAHTAVHACAAEATRVAMSIPYVSQVDASAPLQQVEPVASRFPNMAPRNFKKYFMQQYLQLKEDLALQQQQQQQRCLQVPLEQTRELSTSKALDSSMRSERLQPFTPSAECQAPSSSQLSSSSSMSSASVTSKFFRSSRGSQPRRLSDVSDACSCCSDR